MRSSTVASSRTKPFCFESFGVNVRLRGNDQALIDAAESTARVSLLGKVRKIRSRSFDHEFEFIKKRGSGHMMVHNGLDFGWSTKKKQFFKFFDSILRVSVGECAVDRVFLHSGAVGWRGKAILLPADSFKGKSTLVTELVRLGADYYSDEFAVLDPDGMLHPYSKPISRRTDDGQYRTFELTVEQLKGKYGVTPIPVGTVILTEHNKGQRWRKPKPISPGAAMLAMIPFSLAIRKQPDFTLSVLRKISQDAFVATGKRGDAADYAKDLLAYIDENPRGIQ